MLYPEKLKDNEYVALFFMKTDKNGEPVIGKDGKIVKFHKYVKNFGEYQEHIDKYKHNFHVYNALATVKVGSDGDPHRQKGNMRQQRVLFIDFDRKDYPDLKNAHDLLGLSREVCKF